MIQTVHSMSNYLKHIFKIRADRQGFEHIIFEQSPKLISISNFCFSLLLTSIGLYLCFICFNPLSTPILHARIQASRVNENCVFKSGVDSFHLINSFKFSHKSIQTCLKTSFYPPTDWYQFIVKSFQSLDVNMTVSNFSHERRTSCKPFFFPICCLLKLKVIFVVSLVTYITHFNFTSFSQWTFGQIDIMYVGNRILYSDMLTLDMYVKKLLYLFCSNKGYI